MEVMYRPSHADATYDFKYGIRAVAGGGRSSARETIGRVAAGAVAKKLLAEVCGTEVLAYVNRVRDVEANVDHDTFTLEDIEANPVRCPDATAADAMYQGIEGGVEDGVEGDDPRVSCRCCADLIHNPCLPPNYTHTHHIPHTKPQQLTKCAIEANHVVVR